MNAPGAAIATESRTVLLIVSAPILNINPVKKEIIKKIADSSFICQFKLNTP
jgi:hypothetical protein